MCVFLLDQHSMQAAPRLSTQPLGTQLIFVIWLNIAKVTRLNGKAVVLGQFPEGSQTEISGVLHTSPPGCSPYSPPPHEFHAKDFQVYLHELFVLLNTT